MVCDASRGAISRRTLPPAHGWRRTGESEVNCPLRPKGPGHDAAISLAGSVFVCACGDHCRLACVEPVGKRRVSTCLGRPAADRHLPVRLAFRHPGAARGTELDGARAAGRHAARAEPAGRGGDLRHGFAGLASAQQAVQPRVDARRRAARRPQRRDDGPDAAAGRRSVPGGRRPPPARRADARGHRTAGRDDGHGAGRERGAACGVLPARWP